MKFSIVLSTQSAQFQAATFKGDPETNLRRISGLGIECIGTYNFGLLLDSFHMNIKEPSIEASTRQCGARIFHFHVAYSNR